VSCHFLNSITTTCCQLVVDLLVTSWHVKIVCRVANKSATRWQLSRQREIYWKTCPMDIGNGGYGLLAAYIGGPAAQAQRSKGRRPPGAVSVFIAWTEWTLTMALPWRQHYKYHRDYYYYYYYYYWTLLTAIGLRHVRTSNKSEVAGPTVRGTGVTGGEVDIEVVTVHWFTAVHCEIATGRVDWVHPDLTTVQHHRITVRYCFSVQKRKHIKNTTGLSCTSTGTGTGTKYTTCILFLCFSVCNIVKRPWTVL